MVLAGVSIEVPVNVMACAEGTSGRQQNKIDTDKQVEWTKNKCVEK